MATIRIADEDRTITGQEEISAYLQPHGIWYEKWEVAGRLTDNPTPEEILATYDPEIERLKERGGFVTADVIAVTPETPGLDEMLNKFKKEHTHSEDEVRFTVKGSGVFHIHPDNGPVFAVQVEQGDLINVPKDTKHWFDLCDDRNIQCIRLFEDASGWAPHYTEEPVHENYTALCMGPQYLPPADGSDKPRLES